MSIYAKLMTVQSKLKAPKGQNNDYGHYKYRSCEDILLAVKPLLLEQGLALVINDEIIQVGTRYYVKVTASVVDVENGEHVSNTALAREEETKKGMDASQITGAASSYARKYCLSGLFCIDNTTDADTNEFHKQTHQEDEELEKDNAKEPEKPLISKDETGQTVIFANDGKYYKLANFKLEQLNKMSNSKKYESIWDEIRMLMAYKSKK